MEQHKITFVIPLHRMHIKVFDYVLDSIFSQEIEEIQYEIVIVLNGQGKSPASSRYLNKIEDPRIKVLRYYHEKSCAIARNIGFKYVSNEIVIFLDGDIVLPPDFFKLLIKYLNILKEDQRIAGLCPLFSVNNEPESRLQIYENLEDIRMLDSYRYGAYTKLLQGFCIIVKSSVFSSLGMFDESFIASEDRELTSRVIKAGYNILCMPDIFIKHINPSSFRNILKRKRWHAIGNAQLALKCPGEYDGNILEWLLMLLKRPFHLAPKDIYSYIYYWIIMYVCTGFFLYFKISFKCGLIKHERN